MSVSLQGKWAVVTGADGGIGEQFCKCLASRGADILLVSNNGKGIISLASRLEKEYGVNTRTLDLDLTLPDVARRLAAFMDENWIQPGICINNAGIFAFDEVVTMSESSRNLFLDLHVRAVTEISAFMATDMKSRGGGYILNMSSMSCWMPMPGIALYSATKAYIRVFSRALRCEMKPYGVSVTVACPGGIATNLFGLPPKLMKLAVGLGVIQKPEKFVKKAVDRMLRCKAQHINGITNRIAIFLVSLTPERLRMMVKSRMLDKGIRR